MNIGEAARRSGISAKMIRYYEQIGLIGPAARRESGYRDYDLADLHRLGFLQRARDLGFSVKQMGDLLALWADKDRTSADVKAIARAHIKALEVKRTALEQMIQSLKGLTDQCHGDQRPDCPIIDGLAAPHGSQT